MDTDELDFWRTAVRGEGGFNGHPQAVLALMRVSDKANLDRLRRGFPEAVEAFEEEARASG